MYQQRYETTKVLNISNTTSSGLVVLNDLRLLEIVQQYPFLYNPGVNPLNDRHYDEWAWKCISKQLNRSYAPIEVNFSSKDCKTRWQTLQPLVISLHNASKANNIPDNLRSIVSAIATDMQNSRKPIEYTPAQKFLFSQVGFVERMPIHIRRKLEADIMELIIDTELKAKGNNNLGPTELEQIEREYDDFLKSIRLKELFVLANENNSQEQSSDSGNNLDLCTTSQDSKTSSASKIIKCKIEEKSREPLNSLGGYTVPLKDAHLHIKPCKVRIRRTDVEDLMPLSMLKKEKT